MLHSNLTKEKKSHKPLILLTLWKSQNNVTIEWEWEDKMKKHSDKLMTNYFLSLCNPLFIGVSKYSTIEWEWEDINEQATVFVWDNGGCNASARGLRWRWICCKDW